MAKMTRDMISAEIKLFTEASLKKYDGYAFATGYLESLLASLIEEMPKHKQLSLAQQFRKTVAELEVK